MSDSYSMMRPTRRQLRFLSLSIYFATLNSFFAMYWVSRT